MIALASLSNSVFAATDAATPTTDIVSMVLSLGMVVVLILVLAFFVKKLNPNLTNND